MPLARAWWPAARSRRRQCLVATDLLRLVSSLPVASLVNLQLEASAAGTKWWPIYCAGPARCRWPAWLITSTLPEPLHLVLLRACQVVHQPVACRWWPPVRSRRCRRLVVADLAAWRVRCRRPAWLITSTLLELLHLLLLQACQVVRWPMACRCWPGQRAVGGRPGKSTGTLPERLHLVLSQACQMVAVLLAWPARCRWQAWPITGPLPELLHLVLLQTCQAMPWPILPVLATSSKPAPGGGRSACLTSVLPAACPVHHGHAS